MKMHGIGFIFLTDGLVITKMSLSADIKIDFWFPTAFFSPKEQEQNSGGVNFFSKYDLNNWIDIYGRKNTKTSKLDTDAQQVTHNTSHN